MLPKQYLSLAADIATTRCWHIEQLQSSRDSYLFLSRKFLQLPRNQCNDFLRSIIKNPTAVSQCPEYVLRKENAVTSSNNLLFLRFCPAVLKVLLLVSLTTSNIFFIVNASHSYPWRFLLDVAQPKCPADQKRGVAANGLECEYWVFAWYAVGGCLCGGRSNSAEPDVQNSPLNPEMRMKPNREKSLDVNFQFFEHRKYLSHLNSSNRSNMNNWVEPEMKYSPLTACRIQATERFPRRLLHHIMHNMHNKWLQWF
jgi:hypothetical protein